MSAAAGASGVMCSAADVCVECGVWSVVCGVWCVECGVWSVVVVCGVWSVVCGVWSVVCGVWCVECGVCGVWCGVWSVQKGGHLKSCVMCRCVWCVHVCGERKKSQIMCCDYSEFPSLLQSTQV